MDFSAGQQQPSSVQQEGAIFSAMRPESFTVNADDAFSLEEMGGLGQPSGLSATMPGGTLATLESRLRGMAKMIAGVNMKSAELRKIIADRDAHIVRMEEENAMLSQQVAAFFHTNSQVIDGLAEILGRFHEDEGQSEDDEVEEVGTVN